MSGSDIENSQCERTGESNVVVTTMGDIFAKNHIEDNVHDNESNVGPNSDFPRQKADGAIDNLEELLESPVIDNSVPVVNTVASDLFTAVQEAEFLAQMDLKTQFPDLSTTVIDSALTHNGDSCSSDSFKIKRDMFREELQKTMKFQSLWTELRQHIRTTFNAALETSRSSKVLPLQDNVTCLSDMHDTVVQLCKRDPHQLFMRLVSQAQEFVVEVKVRLLALLHDRSVNNLAEIFLVGLLDDYDALISTASQISELVNPLKEHLCKFNLTWNCFIKKLYQIYVYNDPLVQNNLPPFIGQLRKLLPLKGTEYQGLVHRYLAFDDEMTRIGELWPETEPWMDKYNAEQAVRMTRLRQIREAWELYMATQKLMEQHILSKISGIEVDTQDIDRQLSVLADEEKSIISEIDSRSESLANLDLGLDAPNMPPIIEILQILLDDWNKAQHQKLADIVGGLSYPKIHANGHFNSDSSADMCAAHQLAQLAISSVRAHDEDVSGDIVIEENKGCDCDSHNTSISSVNEKGAIEDIELPANILNSFPPVSDGFIEETVNNAATQVKKKITEKELEQTNVESEKRGDDSSVTSAEPQPCSCVYQHARDIAERKKEILESPPCPCLLNSKRKWDICPCLNKTETDIAATNSLYRPLSPVASVTKIQSEPSKPSLKTGSTQSAQTQTRHSTTQTLNTNHNHSAHQGTSHSHTHGPLPELVKNTGSNHRSHTHNNHVQHACHKQTNVEHIKRVSLSSGDGDWSDSISSHEDLESCSTSSSVQRDSSRHCDCCYCEVFGHGVQSVAPVSRNYNEMRERLRQLLTKKKAKKCKAAYNSPPQSPSESLLSNTNSESKTESSQSVQRSNTPVSMIPPVQQNQHDQRDLEALLEFIEGNQSGKKENNKKAEKKARQKQRKLEEKLKKDRQEAEKQKLLELQKKTPEVTITVVDPQKPVSQRLLPQCNLPEVSILPTSLPVFSTTNSNHKQGNNKRKDKNDVGSNSNVKSKTSVLNSNSKNKNNHEKAGVTNSGQGNKASMKNDKNDNSTNNKLPVNTNLKNNVHNSIPQSIKIESIDKPLTKKERKKLRREMKKMEEAKAMEMEKRLQCENQPQIVTIKRVMESNGSEPTVTITLKGQTPAEDKVLFTLVNGQTKELSQKKESEQSHGGKKKKNKVNNNSNPSQQGNKSQQNNQQKKQQVKVNENNKNVKQQTNDKTKGGKQTIEEKKIQQSNSSETRNVKTKKDKKNTENKENVSQIPSNVKSNKKSQQLNVNKNQQSNVNKKQNKVNAVSQQTPLSQKSQKSPNILPNETNSTKKVKGSAPQEKLNQTNATKNTKAVNTNQLDKSTKNNPKNQNKNNNQSKKRAVIESQNALSERVNSPLSSQLKDIGSNSKINIENLKLPPGITITKVDAPAKPLPIKSAPMPKATNSPKQTTIIAAPMSGVQSSYGGTQAGGNVIVVDTGKLKQDLLPKSSAKDRVKDIQQPQSNTNNRKKKKKKNSANTNLANNNPTAQNKDLSANDHSSDEPARILHNPGTNMVTIRNPAFGPMKVTPTQQAAIIKVSENGMVTIRSPALQQAINAGLTTPAKPDFIVKGDVSSKTQTTSDSSMKNTNGIISSSLAELRSRLTPDCTTLTGLANIQISKVANGHPIPENGINLKGTSVTLTKVRNNETSGGKQQDVQQGKTATVHEAINASMVVAAASSTATGNKGKKKKKRGSGTRQCGDDWNLVESVFTPKDIDLEDGEMDDAERELEAFKRFCLQSVPPPRKEKVNLNIKDIVLKKKSSSSAAAAAAAAVIAAN